MRWIPGRIDESTVGQGGTVVDGSGAPGRRADVLVVGDRIAEIGVGLSASGAQVVDASGALVAPGFIDTHTHLDPSLFWDGGADPMPQHGVTTVLTGNCSLSLVPVRPETVASVSEVFCFIEDMPPAVFAAGIPWSWERFDSYRDALDSNGLAVHVAALIGHSVLRMYVMGEEAWERSATDAERLSIAQVLDECLAAGAFGLSSSRIDVDARRRPVPSRLADDAEFDSLFEVLGAARDGGVHPELPLRESDPGARRTRQSVCAPRRRRSLERPDPLAAGSPAFGRPRRSRSQTAGVRNRAVADDVAAHHRLPDRLVGQCGVPGHGRDVAHDPVDLRSR